MLSVPQDEREEVRRVRQDRLPHGGAQVPGQGQSILYRCFTPVLVFPAGDKGMRTPDTANPLCATC